MKKSKEEMTMSELYWLKAEYERMLAIARDNNCLSQEFKLQEFIEELNDYIIERAGVETGW